MIRMANETRDTRTQGRARVRNHTVCVSLHLWLSFIAVRRAARVVRRARL